METHTLGKHTAKATSKGSVHHSDTVEVKNRLASQQLNVLILL